MGTAETIKVLVNTLTPAAKARLIREMAAEATPTQPDAPRIMRPCEAGKVLSRSVRAIHLLAAQGHLRKITLPGRMRAGGFLASDVYSLIGGKV
ncbi:MAG: hypothetical protein WCS01_11730 [bacterium]